MTEISYTTDGVEMPSFDTQRIENWIVSVARGFGKNNEPTTLPKTAIIT